MKGEKRANISMYVFFRLILQLILILSTNGYMYVLIFLLLFACFVMVFHN